MISVEKVVSEAVSAVLPIARQTLLQVGSHVPTALLHTPEGMFTYVLPFEDDDEKKALTDFIKRLAMEKQAYAVTVITCAKVVDSRTGEESESIVVATAIQGGAPRVVTQEIIRDRERRVIAFYDPVEDDHAAMPGQMFIFPPWHEQTGH